MSSSVIFIAFRLKSFNCRTNGKTFIYIKYVRNSNHLGIIGKSERIRKNIPENIKTTSHPDYVCLQISTTC